MRYNWSQRFTTKLSYEYAYRLPLQSEIFGNGQFVDKNLELRPENSHNFNLQWTLNSNPTTKTFWQVQGNFFSRRINDLIFLVVDPDGFGINENIWSASSQGIELGGKIKDFVKGLTLSANTTYQSYINTSEEGPFVKYKGDRMPNAPYFFANGGANYELENIIQNNGRLSIYWNTRYVYPFLLGWESAGLSQYKAEIPGQITHAVGITQKVFIKKIMAALTLDMQNLTNAKVFDLYGVQRPGRAFYVKLTTQF